ncbi:MAG: hypothetical protein WBC07_06695 [Methylotenera sp.]
MRQFLIVLGLFACVGLSHAEESRPIAVIVTNSHELSVIKKVASVDLSLIYWRKKQYWQGGVRIHPVNLHAEHSLRLNFSKVVLGNLPNEQTNYWNGLYFHGTSPPYSVQSEEAVIRYVANTKGAIGYIDACKVDERVSAVLWIEDNKLSTTKPAFDCGP